MRRSAGAVENFHHQCPSHLAAAELAASMLAWRPAAATADAAAEGAAAETLPPAACLAALEPAKRGMAPKYCTRI